MIVERDALVVDLNFFGRVQIVVNNHLAAGANQGAPQFDWSEPVDVDVGNLAPFKK